MIELSSSTAFMLYLFLTLTTVLGLWIFQHYGQSKKRIVPEEKNLHICEYCHFAYLEEELIDVNKCPQCNSYNKHNKYK